MGFERGGRGGGRGGNLRGGRGGFGGRGGRGGGKLLHQASAVLMDMPSEIYPVLNFYPVHQRGFRFLPNNLHIYIEAKRIVTNELHSVFPWRWPRRCSRRPRWTWRSWPGRVGNLKDRIQIRADRRFSAGRGGRGGAAGAKGGKKVIADTGIFEQQLLTSSRSSSNPIVTRAFSSLVVEKRICSRPRTSCPESPFMERRGFLLRIPATERAVLLPRLSIAYVPCPRINRVSVGDNC